VAPPPPLAGSAGVTASARGLAVLAALAVALGVVHLVAGRPAPPPSRAPFADLDPAVVSGVRWTRAGHPAVTVIREGGGWTMTAPSPGPADATVMNELLDMVRAARWQRRAAAAPGSARATVTLERASGAPLVLAIGPDVPGAGAWVGDGRAAYLFEPWLIELLDRGLDPVEVRRRAVLAMAPAQVTALELHAESFDLVLVGSPLAIANRGELRIDPAVAAGLLEQIGALRVESLVDAAHGPPAPGTTLRVIAGGTVEHALVRGPCPDRPDEVWIGGSAGEVCASGEALTRALGLAAMIAALPERHADRRPVAGPITEVTLASGATLRWRGAAVEVAAPSGEVHPADDEAVARVVAALTGAADVVALPAARPPATGAITVVAAAGAERLELLRGGILARATGAAAHRLAPDAVAALQLPAAALRDRTLWRTEPSLLTGFAVADRAPYTITADDPWAREVAEALAAPRAVRFLATPPAIARTFDLAYAPPPTAGAAPELHRLGVGARVADGCAAVADGTPVVLHPDLCTLLGKAL
jgi:hypothetical protein